ncbi:uridine kinase family protein [Rhodoglobus vestalii]|uniref:uridine kinase family protein n=1 Tax=Rhodoglobus vestalii TaxID=193384 RepID=UPI001FEB2BE1|nr:phosphoglycerate transporter [Rhodoglobus vestalii]
MTLDGLIGQIDAQRRKTGPRTIVGISGYCGSGKSTLTRQLVAAVPDSKRMRGDDFLDPVRSHRRSSDWDGVERLRLASEVLAPRREGRPSTFRRYDWSQRQLGTPEPLPVAQILVVDLIGLFHAEALPFIDLTIWCDVDLQTAARRGMERDEKLGRNHGVLWRDVWIPNERDFHDQFSPRTQADIRYSLS